MKAISKLNLGKAPDSHELTMEHLRFGGPRLIKYITLLINAVMRQSYISSCLKECAVLLQELLLETNANNLRVRVLVEMHVFHISSIEYYEALLDAKSAFDVVYQNSLSRTLAVFRWCSW